MSERKNNIKVDLMQNEDKAVVLIVDDEPALNELFVLGLKKYGFDTEGVLGGVQCLEKLRSGYRPDIILLDMIMDQMDGWETLRNIKRNEDTGDILVLMQTGKNLTHQEARTYFSEIMGYIMKPITPKSSIGHIERSLYLHKSFREIRDAAVAAGLPADEVNDCIQTYRGLMVAKELAALLDSKYGAADDMHEAEEFSQCIKRLEKKYERLNAKLNLNLESVSQRIDTTAQ